MATNSRLSANALRFAVLVVGFCLLLVRVSAHPMPNTMIDVTFGDDRVRLDVAVPLAELRLALDEPLRNSADLLGEPQRSALVAYFRQHCSVQWSEGPRQPVTVESLSLSGARDENVGPYQELRVRMSAPAPDVTVRNFRLHYDAVIHQVPNHFAVVTVARQRSDAVDAGVIRYDFARQETLALAISVGATRQWPATFDALLAASIGGIWLVTRIRAGRRRHSGVAS